VSNHGARQLDTVPPTIEVLEEVVEAVKGRKVEIFFDGGIRRGSDVLKALALGANAVFVGRPILWGLAVGGQKGVERVLSILNDELKQSMIYTGCMNI
jgi:(S)-2-hydroxy-acid oxidase